MCIRDRAERIIVSPERSSALVRVGGFWRGHFPHAEAPARFDGGSTRRRMRARLTPSSRKHLHAQVTRGEWLARLARLSATAELISEKSDDPLSGRDDADDEQNRREHDERDDASTRGLRLGRCSEIAVEQVDVSSIGLDAEVEQVAEHGDDAYETVERDVAEHSEQHRRRNAFLPGDEQNVARHEASE